jgi:hypothetical protein
MIKNSIDLKDENSSEASSIELDLEISDNDHANKVYCRCFLCAEEGHGGAWVSKNTRTRHMKSHCARQRPILAESSSSSSGSESPSDNTYNIMDIDNDEPIQPNELSLPDENTYELLVQPNDLFLSDAEAETSLSDRESSPYTQENDASDGFLQESYYDETSSDSSSEDDNSQYGILIYFQ